MSDRDGSVTVCADRGATARVESVTARSLRPPLRALRLGLLASACFTAPQIAWAQCVPSGTELVYVCSGANTTPQVVTANPALHNVTVTTVPGFNVDTTTTGGSALVITGDGELRYLDFAASTLKGADTGLQIITTESGVPGSILVNAVGPISGDNTGIDATNNASGALAITTIGTVTGGSARGIHAENRALATTDLTVNAAAVTGGDTGVLAVNVGTGSTSVTTTGAVVGTSGYGIFAQDNRGTNLTVNSASVRGAIGVYAGNWGSGSVSVTATGDVEGTTGRGIFVENLGVTATALKVDAAAATGGSGGIHAANYGTGDTSVRATGVVVGTSQFGIEAINHTRATDLVVNAVSVTGGSTGLYVVNRGTGKTSATATGDVIGTSQYGILAVNGTVTLNANGTVDSVTGPQGTSLTVEAVGVRGGNTGIFAVNTGNGATSVTATGDVEGGSVYGILAVNGFPTLNADGTVSFFVGAGNATDLKMQVIGVKGGDSGIYAVNAGRGATSLTAKGDVVGTSAFGISVVNQATATDMTIAAVAVTGGQQGINAVNYGTGFTSVTATGDVVGTGFGGITASNVAAGTDLTIKAVGVTGRNHGIDAVNGGTGKTSVTATGNVVGTSLFGIRGENFARTTDLTVDAAAVTAGRSGILAINRGTGTTSVTANGAVGGVSQYGILAVNGAPTFRLDGTVSTVGVGPATDLSVQAVGVKGGISGIFAVNAGRGMTSVTATGTVEGGALYGVLAANGLATFNVNGTLSTLQAVNATDLTVQAADVKGGLSGVVAINAGTGATSVVATGPVEGALLYGIQAQNMATATKLGVTAAAVTGAETGILAFNRGTGSTSIAATGAAVGLASYGIFVENAATATGLMVNAVSARGKLSGIYAVNQGTGFTSVKATGDVEGTQAYGILAVNGQVTLDAGGLVARIDGDNGTSLAVEAVNVRGGEAGVYAVNTGTASTSVTVRGLAQGGGVAILARNDSATAKDLRVGAAAVTGGTIGIYASNSGTGVTTVDTLGTVQGGSTGILAQNDVRATDLSVKAQGPVSGGANGDGVSASNNGTGSTSVSALGAVQGGRSGIFSESGAATTLDLTVNAASVTGGQRGIYALNRGAAATMVKATGDAAGTAQYGIAAVNGTVVFGMDDSIAEVTGNSGTNLTVETAGATGGIYGILAVNTGTGFTSVMATGDVVGTLGMGIVAINGRGNLVSVFPDVDGNNGTDLTVKAASVSGGFAGIYAENTGTGATSVTAAGLVRGEQVGLYVKNENTATNLTINAAAATGGIGIYANNEGTGFTSVTAAGTVEAAAFGIYVQNEAATTDLTVKAAAVNSQSYGILAVNEGTGATLVTATGNVVGTQAIGILAANGKVDSDPLPAVTGNNGTTLTVEAGSVTGGVFGIAAINTGTGATSVTATGDVVGIFGIGIVAVNGRTDLTSVFPDVDGNNGTDLTVKAATVSGNFAGIYAENTGTGATSVTATGLVRGEQVGLYAKNENTATNLTVNAAAATGSIGIFANNEGTGFTLVTATGTVQGGFAGIYALHEATATDLTVNAARVESQGHGILAVSEGTGATLVTATGDIVGTTGVGILAVNGKVDDVFAVLPEVTGNNGTSLTVNAVGVSGGTFGIYAANTGSGATSVTTAGLVQGGFYGLYVENKATATDLTVSTAAVNSTSGGGIFAGNAGTGATSVTATGNVAGSILAVNGTVNGNAVGGNNGTNLAVEAAGVTSGFLGVLAVNTGTGFTSVKATGDVVGTSGYGILAVNGQVLLDNVVPTVVGNNGTSLTVEAAGVTGGQFGVYAVNTGTGATLVSVSGVVQGGTNAIFATANNQAVDLQFAATAQVGNANLLSSALAVSASGSSVTLANNGQLTGAVQLTGLNNQITNSGTWSTAGAVNSLGGPTSQLTNSASGIVLAASSGGTLETTQFQGAGNFLNRGTVSLRDGGAGDVVRFGGNAIMTATSVQAIDLGNGTADRIVVDGVANLSGTLVVSKTGGGYQLGGRYTVLTAAGGLNGRYSALAGDAGQISTFFSVVDAYDANNAYLDVAQQRPFSAAAFTPNQAAAAGGAQSLPIGNPLFNAIATLQTDAQARVAFDQISGEAHASGRTALNEGSRLVRDAALGRLRAAFGGPAVSAAPSTAQVASYADECGAETCQASADPAAASRYAVWAQGLGSWGSTDGNGNAAGLFRTNAGFLVGADAQVFDVGRLGLFGGYTRTTFNVADRQSSGGSDNAHLGLYGGAQFGPIGVRLGAAYSWHTLSATRGVAFPGFADTLRSDYAARTVQVFGELGYRIPVNKVTFEPFANVAYSNLTTDGFTEKGGAAALSVAGSSTNVTTTTLGLRTAYSFQLGDAPSQVRGMLGWQHAFGDVTPLANMVLNGGSPFTVSGIPIAQNSALIEAGFDVRLSERVSLGATYTGQFASGVQDQTVRANVTLNF